MIAIPESHPRRRQLNDEAHARPPESLLAPSRISFLALYDDGIDRAAHHSSLRDICERHGVAPPSPDGSHFSRDFGAFRLKWEKHTEFTRYEIIVRATETEEPFSLLATEAVPGAWLGSLPGRLIAASHVALVRSGVETPDVDDFSRRCFGGNALVGAYVANRAALAFTDYRFHEDGFSRFLVLDHHLAPRQAGRTVQRLLEGDAYRVLALLALPIARELGPFLATAEADLVRITSAMAKDDAIDEPGLLDQLTRLEAQIQQRYFQTTGRFSAADAYYRLVQRRTEELREQRLESVQTFGEFVERRLSPAMSTCVVTAGRQEKLSQRVAETTQLLSTRVDVTRQKQNQSVLASMNRRVLLQLRMQQTVEGLSVAAITYYVVGLVSYVMKGISFAGLPISAEVIVALSVPVVAALVAVGVHRIRVMVAPTAPRSGLGSGSEPEA